MQYHYNALLLILMEDYTSSYIFSGYNLHSILILDTRNWVMFLVKKPLALHCDKIQRQDNINNSQTPVHSH